MKVNILILICAAVVSVSAQFIETEYRLDSAPLPIRRRTGNVQYEIQPSIGQEIEFSTQTTRISTQERRHIEKNPKGNIQNSHINVQNFEIKPFHNMNPTGPEIYDARTANRQTYGDENQFSARLQEQNFQNDGSESNNQYSNRNRNIGSLKTNLDNPQNHHQGNLDNQPNYPPNHNLRTSENAPNEHNRRIHDGSRPEYALNDNLQINQNPTNQQVDNSRTNLNNENINNNRRTEASLRAIDSDGYRQQNIDSTTNNRNYNTKPGRQNTETTRKIDRNYENRQTTEPTRIYTIDDKSVTGGSKSTDDNELAAKSHPEGRVGNKEEDKWIWNNAGGKTTKTTAVPTNLTVDDRAAFSGDKCPTGQVRFNNTCVDID